MTPSSHDMVVRRSATRRVNQATSMCIIRRGCCRRRWTVSSHPTAPTKPRTRNCMLHSRARRASSIATETSLQRLMPADRIGARTPPRCRLDSIRHQPNHFNIVVSLFLGQFGESGHGTWQRHGHFETPRFWNFYGNDQANGNLRQIKLQHCAKGHCYWLNRYGITLPEFP